MRFSGRDTRSEFWPYAAAAVGLYFVFVLPVSFAQSLKTLNRFYFEGGLMFAILVALLAAAIARRLHDIGLSAFWGLLPLLFVTYSITMFIHLDSQFATGEPDMGLFYSVVISDVLYFVATVWLIVLLARRSASGPNRFG